MGLFSKKKANTTVADTEQESVSAGIPGDVIAAISAAVACVMGEGARIRGIRREAKASDSRSAWSLAGLLDNTRPF